MRNKKEIVKRFRKVAWGRLYWRRANMRWRDRFDSDDICIVKNGTITDHYKTIEALLDDITRAEEIISATLV